MLKKHYESSTFMAARPSDTTNIVVLPKKNGAPPCREPTPTLTVTEISTSALECLVLQSETKSVRRGFSGGDIEESLISNRERLRHTDSRSADSGFSGGELPDSTNTSVSAHVSAQTLQI
mgnify:CR=1 FL=1